MFSFKKKWDDVCLFWFFLTMNTSHNQKIIYIYNIRNIHPFHSIEVRRYRKPLLLEVFVWSWCLLLLDCDNYKVSIWCDMAWLLALFSFPWNHHREMGMRDLFWYRIASVPGDSRCAGWVRSWMSSSAGDSGSTCGGPVHRGATGGASRHRGCDLVTWWGGLIGCRVKSSNICNKKTGFIYRSNCPVTDVHL